jgi:hypothetical protein
MEVGQNLSMKNNSINCFINILKKYHLGIQIQKELFYFQLIGNKNNGLFLIMIIPLYIMITMASHPKPIT